MSVDDVCTMRVPSASSTSAGRPVCGSAIAASEAHVRWAYCRSGELCALGAAADGDAVATAAATSVTSTAGVRVRMVPPGWTDAARPPLTHVVLRRTTGVWRAVGVGTE